MLYNNQLRALPVKPHIRFPHIRPAGECVDNAWPSCQPIVVPTKAI
jgi:hypothetical protein